MKLSRILVSISLVAGLAFAIGVPATTVAASSATATVTPTSCTDGTWPTAVDGVPTDLHLHGAAGDYLWHASDGWHLRVTHPGDGEAVFTGTIVSSAPVAVHGYALEGADWFALSADHRIITFRFTNYGEFDGLNFVTDCASAITFHLSMGGHTTPTADVFLGHANSHPATVPFTVRRS